MIQVGDNCTKRLQDSTTLIEGKRFQPASRPSLGRTSRHVGNNQTACNTCSRGSTLICTLFSSHRPPFVFHLRLRCFPFPHLYSLHGESFSNTAAPVQAPPDPGSRAIAHLFSPLRCSCAAMARCYRSWRRLQSTKLQPSTSKATTGVAESCNQS